jgi:hypothetical protein
LCLTDGVEPSSQVALFEINAKLCRERDNALSPVAVCPAHSFSCLLC